MQIDINIYEMAENHVRNHKDFPAEGFSDYMNGFLNGYIEGAEAIEKIYNERSNPELCK